MLLFVTNLSPVPRGPYRLGLPRAGRWVEAINTDSTYYGGTDTGNYGGVEAEPIPWHNQAFSAEITLPPLGAHLARPRGAEADQRNAADGMTIRVLLCDDHAMVREGLARLLAAATRASRWSAARPAARRPSRWPSGCSPTS